MATMPQSASSSPEMEYAVNKGKVGIFVVSGGSGGYTGCCGGRSGHFAYQTVDVVEDHTRVVMVVGLGGYGGYRVSTSYGWGKNTEVYVDKGGPNEQLITAEGGRLDTGWSMGRGGRDSGCRDGYWGGRCWRAPGRKLKDLSLPYTSVTGAPGGLSYYYSYYDDHWGGGGGGVALDGSYPSPSNIYYGTGLGYGGGGGNYNRHGMNGVAVFFTGTGVVPGNDMPYG